MAPPSSHRSLKTSSALQKMAISAEILTKIEGTVKLATNSQTPNLKSIESQLLKFSDVFETYSKKKQLGINRFNYPTTDKDMFIENMMQLFETDYTSFLKDSLF